MDTKVIKQLFNTITILGCMVLLSACQNNTDKPVIPKKTSQLQLNELANTLQVKYNFLSNIEEDCPDLEDKKITACYGAEIWLTSPVNSPINAFELNFSQVYPVYASRSADFTVEHLNGDVHQISPKISFSGFKANETKKIKLWVKSTLLTESELMPNYWLKVNGLQPVVIASTKTIFDQSTGLEKQPWVIPFTNISKQIKSSVDDINEYASLSWLYENEEGLNKFDQGIEHVDYGIIPTPKSVKLLDKSKRFDYSKGIKLSLKGIDKLNISAALSRLDLLGLKVKDEAESIIEIVVNKQVKKPLAWRAGHYKLTINETVITINAQDDIGAFYGLQSLASLTTLGATTLPLVAVDDQPHYEYRGQHVDVGRNFHDKAFIFRLIEQMAAYKLNKLHLHLAEDEGWRLEIPDLPELTEVGSKRCMSLTDENCLQPQLGGAQASDRDGFYSVSDYKEILKYASKHFIQVIPSLDMPGHSRAAIKAMEVRYKSLNNEGNKEAANQYILSDFSDRTEYSSIQNYSDNTLNVCMESTYNFINKVIDELKVMHEEANHPLVLYHIGADETAGAWLDSPACKPLIVQHGKKHLGAHFIERVAEMVANKGIAVAGWNDGLKETRKAAMPKNTYSYIWGALPWGAHQQVSEQSHRGWNIVLSIPDVLYFDFPYQIDPKEPGYNWASRSITTRSLFNFMPDNLPIHAEFRLDTLGKNFEIDDTLQKDKNGNISHQPLAKGFNVKGIQGQLWSETVRSEQQAEYMIYPRLLALAERAWHQPSWHVPYDYNGKKFDKNTNNFTQELKNQRDKSWLAFSQVVGFKELPKLENSGVFYRIPSLGAKIQKGKLHVKSAMQGVPIEYQENATPWQLYSKPVKVTGDIKVRAKTTNLERNGRTRLLKK